MIYTHFYKYFPVLVTCFSVLTTISGQVPTSLKVKYSETFHFEIPEHLKSMGRDFPTSREMKKILYTEGALSSYIPNKEDKDEEVEELGQRRGRRWRMQDQVSNLYIDRSSSNYLHLKDLFGKEFTVAADLPERKWKIIATEQRDILGYTCMKAEYQDTSQLITAWFTPQIPISAGPDDIQGLPGLVLATSVGEDKIILATEVILNPEGIVIEKPSDKKTISPEEFEKLREEKMEEQKAMWRNRF